MANKQKPPSQWTDEDRRTWGYTTIDEFVDKFSMGLRAYLHNNWKSTEPEDVHHPEDLTSNMLCYAESVYTTIEVFGMGNSNAKDW
jgi:hypothetical protein